MAVRKSAAKKASSVKKGQRGILRAKPASQRTKTKGARKSVAALRARPGAPVAKKAAPRLKKSVHAARKASAVKKAVKPVKASKPAAVVPQAVQGKTALFSASLKAKPGPKNVKIQTASLQAKMAQAKLASAKASLKTGLKAAGLKKGGKTAVLAAPKIFPSRPLIMAVPARIVPVNSSPFSGAAAARPASESLNAPNKRTALGYRVGEHVVYPTHGVGKITAIQQTSVAGLSLELFVLYFENEKMTLRVPFAKVQQVGMRKISDEMATKKAMETLKGRPRIKRTMWSRRAQEYEAKINSGDMSAVAEVVRDLYRADTQPEQSYSERQLYEAALDRMAREVAVVRNVNLEQAVAEIVATLQKGPRRGRAEIPSVELQAANDDEETAQDVA